MMYDGHSFYINDPNWRNYTSKTELVYVSPEIVATEYEVLLAIEKLTPYTQRVHERYPTVDDIITFFLMINGQD